MDTRLLIIGGGICGCAAARSAAGSARVTLVEARPRLGGLQRSVTCDGLVFDIGTFVFDEGSPMFEIFPALRPKFPSITFAAQLLTPRLRLASHPPTLLDYRRENGALKTVAGLARLLTDRMRFRRRDTLHAFVRYYLGREIYERSGLRGSIERFYELDESEIDVDYARQRLRGLADAASVGARLRAAMRRAATGDGRAGWRCLVPPPRGFDEIFEPILAELSASGVEVLLDTPVTRIDSDGDGHTVTFAGAEHRFDRIISTIPLPSLASAMGVDHTAPEYLSLVSLFYRGTLATSSPVLYNFTATGGWRRVVTHFADDPESARFTVECPRREVGPDSVDQAAAEFERHGRASGISLDRFELVGSTVTRCAYPLLRRGYAARLSDLRSVARRRGISCCGRQGSFIHCSSAEAVSAGARAGRAAARGEAPS